MSYKLLIEGQRYQIEAYLREGFSYREIGKRLVTHGAVTEDARAEEQLKTLPQKR